MARLSTSYVTRLAALLSTPCEHAVWLIGPDKLYPHWSKLQLFLRADSQRCVPVPVACRAVDTGTELADSFCVRAAHPATTQHCNQAQQV